MFPSFLVLTNFALYSTYQEDLKGCNGVMGKRDGYEQKDEKGQKIMLSIYENFSFDNLWFSLQV